MTTPTPWRFERIPTMAMTITDMVPSGELAPIDASLQPRAGVMIAHWWAPELATSWFTWARALLALVESGTVGRRPATPLDLYQVFGAILNGYNALNVPWYMHAVARNLYRRYLAGPPYGGTGDPLGIAAKFSKDRNYSYYVPSRPDDFGEVGWYRPNTNIRSGDAAHANEHVYPAGKGFGGIIPHHGRQLFVHFYPFGEMNAIQRVNNFVPWIEPDIAPYSELESVIMTPGGVAVRAAYRETVTNVLYPYESLIEFMNSRGNCRFAAPQTVVRDGATQVLPEDTNCKSSPPEMQSFYFDQRAQVAGLEVGNDYLAMASPMADYVPWARAWLDALASLTPAQIVVGVRYYTTYVNTRQAADPDFQRAASTADAKLLTEERQRNPTLTAVSAGITAVGGAIAVAVPGIGTVLGGVLAAVGAGIAIADSLAPHGTTDLFRDDLGRIKPTFERSSLGGSPVNPESSGQPLFAVPTPPASPVQGGPFSLGWVADALRATMPTAPPTRSDRATSQVAAIPPRTPLYRRPAVGLAFGAVLGLILANVLDL